MFKGLKLTGLAAGILLGASIVGAEAAPIQGDFSITGNFLPVVGTTGVRTTLGAATALDFINFFGSTPTPGVAGIVNVNAAAGDFSPLAGSSGTIRDFAFSGAGSAKFPIAPVLAFQSFPAGGLTFDLIDVGIVLQTSTFLVLSGTGIFHMTGFEDTVGSFDFSGNGSRSTFSFSSTQAAAVPEPASNLALAIGLLGGAGYLRRRLPARS